MGKLKTIASQPMRAMKPEEDVLARYNRYTQKLEEEAEAAPLPAPGHAALKVVLLLAYCDDDTVAMDPMLVGFS